MEVGQGAKGERTHLMGILKDTILRHFESQDLHIVELNEFLRDPNMITLNDRGKST